MTHALVIVRVLSRSFTSIYEESADLRLRRHAARMEVFHDAHMICVCGRIEHKVLFKRLFVLYRHAKVHNLLTAEGLEIMESFLMEINARIREISK